MPDGWAPAPFQSGASLAWDHAVARSGKASLRIENPRKSDSKLWQQSTARWNSLQTPVQPGSEYTLQLWVKTREVSGRARVLLSWQKSDGSFLDHAATEPLTGTSDWKQLAISATAPAGAATAAVFLELSGGPGAAWFDDIVVSGKTTPPAPTLEYSFNDTGHWFPFTFRNDDTNLDGIDLTEFLEAPAGGHGFVTVRGDGHFYFEDGKRARFFGTNLGGRDCAPEKDVARAAAARFAKFGVNMVRLHSIDSAYAAIIDYSGDGSREFDPERLDRMDYLIAEFKKHGIYVYLDLLDYRMFRSADGVKHGDEFTANWEGSMKGASIFDERMIELQKEYATKLLTHENPYTGLAYLDDPAIATLEITNENAAFYFLLNRKLSHPYYREELVRRWNRWLAGEYGGRAALDKAWTGPDDRAELLADEDPAQNSVQLPRAEVTRMSKGAAEDPIEILWGPARTRDALRFLGEIQEHYYREMRTHLEQIGVRIPVTGTNQTFILKDTEINARFSDFISRNQYWRHPNKGAKPFFKFANDPMVRSDLARER
ncbi:MAG: hypothetical protein ACC661_12105, partial [Verrucomicrobiales bacterium]